MSNLYADIGGHGSVVAGVTREKNRVLLISGAADSDLTDTQCSPNTVHWTYDTWALAHGTGGAVVKNAGKTWFFITADYAFGHALARDTSAVVKVKGGQVLGEVFVPLNTLNFSSYLLQPRLRRDRSSALPMRVATRSTRSNRPLSLASLRGAAPRRATGVPFQRSRPGLVIGPRFDPDHGVLLGPQRPIPHICQTVRREDRRQISHHGACRRLFLGAALFAGG